MTLQAYLQQHYTKQTTAVYLHEINNYTSGYPQAAGAVYKDVVSYMGALRSRHSNASTLNRILCSIKAYYDFLYYTGVRSDNPARSIKLRDQRSRDVQLQDLFTAQEKDAYSRCQEIRFTLPWQFLYLCKLTGVTPHDMLDQFMNNLGQESWKRHPNDGVRQNAIDYFIQCGYGQDFYSQEDLRSMFRELDAIGSLWPRTGKMKLIDLHAKWRNKYYDYWFKKWYYLMRRKKP